MARTPLDAASVRAELDKLAGWTFTGERLQRRFEFEDFARAFGWMASVALVAEKLDHHPDWSNVYRTVDVQLWTHDAGGITPVDFKLAAAMNRLAGE